MTNTEFDEQGRPQGRYWVREHSDGSKAYCRFKDGVVDGDYNRIDADGRIIDCGRYENGKKQGDWLKITPEGTTIFNTYQDNIEHGPYKAIEPDGTVVSGQMERNKKEGVWLVKNKDGSYWEMTYQNDTPHGPCREYDQEGKLCKAGMLVNDEQEGLWWQAFSDGQTVEYTCVNGLKHGPFSQYLLNEDVAHGTFYKDKFHGGALRINRYGRVVNTNFWQTGVRDRVRSSQAKLRLTQLNRQLAVLGNHRLALRDDGIFAQRFIDNVYGILDSSKTPARAIKKLCQPGAFPRRTLG